MWARKILYIFFLFFPPVIRAYSQQETDGLYFEASGGYSSSAAVPFWFRSMRSGSIPGEGFSGGLVGSLHKGYGIGHKIKWGAGLRTRLNAESYPDLKLIEGYLKAKVSFFEIKGGRSQDIMGLCDTSLTSGSFSISGNAPGIPSIQIGIPEFTNLPFLRKMISIKANYSHGWMGNTSTNMDGLTSIQKTFFHQKSLYLRIGKPDRRLYIYGGLNHQVVWGNEKSIFGNAFTLSSFIKYYYVITAKDYSTNLIKSSRIGNHLGSIDLGAEYNFSKFKLFIYRQNFFDFVALKYLANISDGLNGLSLTNRNTPGRVLGFKKALIEFLYSKDQGTRHSKKDPTFYNENYYNNYIYQDGWSYKDFSLGNPLLTSKTSIRQGLSDEEYDYFHNNRVAAVHSGFEGNLLYWQISLRMTYSRNFGTYFSPFARNVGQFSGWLEMSRNIRNLNLGLRTAFDKGDLLYNSKGLIIFISGQINSAAK